MPLASASSARIQWKRFRAAANRPPTRPKEDGRDEKVVRPAPCFANLKRSHEERIYASGAQRHFQRWRRHAENHRRRRQGKRQRTSMVNRLSVGDGNVDDSYQLPPAGYGLTVLRESERNQLTGRVLPPCGHDNVLLAVLHVGHRSPRRPSGQLHLPQHFA